MLLLSVISLAPINLSFASTSGGIADITPPDAILQEQKRRAPENVERIREERRLAQEVSMMAAEDKGFVANITPYYANEEKYTELLSESMRTNDKAMIFSLLTHRHNELLTTTKRRDILRLAAEYGLSSVVEKLLKDKIKDVFSPQYIIDVPHGVFGAAKGGQIQIMAYLLSIYKTQSEGAKQLVVNKAFYEAVLSKNTEMVVYLLNQPFGMPLPVLSAEQLVYIQKIRDGEILSSLEKRKQANEMKKQALKTDKIVKIIEAKLFSEPAVVTPEVSREVAR